MSILARLFMNPYQKALDNPANYERALDPSKVKSELKAKRAGRCPETIAFMLSEIDSIVDRKRPLSIAQVVDDKRSLQSALSRPHDPSLHEFGICAHMGAESLASYLIQRANDIGARNLAGAPLVAAT